MTRLLATGAAAFLLVSGAAFAVPKGLYPHHASAADLAAAEAGQGSLNRAISAVERLTGGRVLEIHFESGSGGAGFYEAAVMRDGTVDRALVNLSTRQVALVDRSSAPVRTFDFKEKADSELVIQGSKTPLADAVAKAERSSRGVAVAARTVPSGDGYMIGHSVDTVRGDMVHPVVLDAKTGQIIADVQAFIETP